MERSGDINSNREYRGEKLTLDIRFGALLRVVTGVDQLPRPDHKLGVEAPQSVGSCPVDVGRKDAGTFISEEPPTHLPLSDL